ncbi:hypothetical protein [Terrisporobacter petrolearius]|uniref:hypothetical protein n=1 Tax=Terrisporobacter petrolearius TaxID=1460447 RepID=UPI003AFFA08D
MSLYENIEINGVMYKYSLEGHINIKDYTLGIKINVPKNSNIEKEDLEYINPMMKTDDSSQEEATLMFISAISDYIKLPVGDVVKTIEVKGKIYEAGLPGLIVELGNCIKVENIK